MRDYDLVRTNELKANDLVRVSGAVLRLYGHTASVGPDGLEHHVFKTEVADVGEWPHAKRDLKDYEVHGTHLDLWARIKQ